METPADQPTRRRRSPLFWAIVALWVVVTGWLLISMITSVVGALFYGNGPITQAVEDAPAPTGIHSTQTPPQKSR